MKNKRMKKELNFGKVICVLALIQIVVIIICVNKSKNTKIANVTIENQMSNQQTNVSTENQTAQNNTNTTEKKSLAGTLKCVDGSNLPIYKNSGVGGLPVTMYHFFYDASAGETGKDANYTEISSFENQIRYLVNEDFYFPTWEEVVKYVDGEITLPEKSIVLTVDDGDESFFKLALPVIKKYDVKVTEFLVTSWNGWYHNDYKADQMYYESHSDNMHKGGANGKGVMLSWTHDQLLADVTQSRKVLDNEAIVFCYPFGQYNDLDKQVLKEAGYKLAFTTEGGRVKKGQDKYALPRVRISKGISVQDFADRVN